MRAVILFFLLVFGASSVWGQGDAVKDMVGVDFECSNCILKVKIIPTETTSCGAEDFQLKTNLEGTYDYYWEEVGNPTNNGTEPTFLATSTGEYGVTVTDTEGCEATDLFIGESLDGKIAETYFLENGFMSFPITLENQPSTIAPKIASPRNNLGGGDRLGVNVAIEGITGFVDLNSFLAAASTEIQLSYKCEDFEELKGFYEDANDLIWGHFIPITKGSLEGILFLGSKTSSFPNNAHQHIVNLVNSQWDDYKENVEESFLGFNFNLSSTAQFANSDVGNTWYENLVQFFFDCPDGTIAPAPGGFIPTCFWDVDISILDQRTVKDPAFGAGLIDGVYANTFGLQELADGIGELLNALADRPFCIVTGFDSVEDYNQLIAELEALDKDPTVVNWFKKRWKGRNVSDKSECIAQAELLKKVENFFGKVFEVSTDFRKFTNTFLNLIYNVAVHVGDISYGIENEDRYKLSRTIVDFVFLFINPGSRAKLADESAAVFNKLDVLLAGKSSSVLDNISEGLVAKLKTLEQGLIKELEKDIIESNDLLAYLSTNTTLPNGTVISYGRKVDAWAEVLSRTVYSQNANAVDYVSRILREAKVGTATTTDYLTTWRTRFPNLQGGGFNVHHSIERQIQNKWPGLFNELEIHSLENLRGISGEINPNLHLSKIRLEWDKFYDLYPPGTPPPTRQAVLDYATQIDFMFGNLFSPPIR